MREYKNLLTEPVMRTIRLPAELWNAAKERGVQNKRPMREVLEEASRTIPGIIADLRALGVRGEYRTSKVFRAPLAPAVLEAVRQGHEATGLPQIQILALALHRLTQQGIAATVEAKPTQRRGRRKTPRE